MKVSDIIANLQGFNQDAEVLFDVETYDKSKGQLVKFDFIQESETVAKMVIVE
jgi:hypothetical protein